MTTYKDGPRPAARTHPEKIAKPSITTAAPTGTLQRSARRREHLLKRLREADGPHYDTLCAELADAFPARNPWWAGAQAVRAVRDALWDELATVDENGSLWLLPAGWQAGA